MNFSVKQYDLLRGSKRPPIWSVRFARSSQTGTRADAARALVATPSVSGEAVRNDFDRISFFDRPVFNATWDKHERRWINLVPCGSPAFSWSPTEPYREVVYRCRPFWYRLDMDADYAPIGVSVTDRPLPGFALAPMFKNGRDAVYRPCFEMGIGEDGLPHSRAGLTPHVGKVTALMDKAREYDSRARIESVKDWFSDLLLQMVEFASYVAPSAINGNRSDVVVATGSILPQLSATSGSSGTNTPCAWRGKENPWKNVCSGLCDVFLKKSTEGGQNSITVCVLDDISKYDGQVNEHYVPVGLYVQQWSGALSVRGYLMNQDVLYPAISAGSGVSIKGYSYLYADFAGSLPIGVAVGGNSTTAMLSTSYISSPLSWECADLSNWRSGHFGGRLILDEGGSV